MRYKLDSNGFIKYVLFGCYTGGCAEYTGAVPSGYSDLVDWANNACINAYYLDENGNLVLDVQRQNYLQTLHEQQAIDYSPVLHNELFATNEVIEAQYKKNTVSGTIIEITDARNISPMVRITGLTGNSLSVFAQTKNMLRNDAESQSINGLVFTRKDGNIAITGTSTAPVEYILSDGGTEPLFALLAGRNYYLNTGGLSCELLYFNGETTEQVYTGTGGVINLSESKRVTQVKLKFGAYHSLDVVLTPRLNVGTSSVAYEECQTKVYNIELPEHEEDAVIVIGEGLAVLYSGDSTSVVGRQNMGLLNGYNMIYTSQGNALEITYTTNEFLVDDMAFLQGTSTTTGKFKILEDGSIVATNGQFSGELVCTALYVADGAEVKGLKVGENVEMSPGGVITWDELPGDVASTSDILDPDDVTTITQNAIKTGNIIIGGLIYDKTITGKQVILGVNSDGNLQVGTPKGYASYKDLNLYAGPGGTIKLFPDAAGTNSTDMFRIHTYGADFGVPVFCYELSATEFSCDSIETNGNVDIGGELYCKDSYTSTVSYNPNMYVGTGGRIRRTTETSSREVKDDIILLQDEDLKAEKLYDAEVVQFKYKPDVLPETDMRYRINMPGFIVEDLEKVYPIAVDKDENGKPFGWNYRYMIPSMLKLIQDQKKEIEELKTAINEIKNMIGGTV